jgi:valyl-tRNA synthetase
MIASQPPGQRNQHWDQQVAVLQADHFTLTHTWRIEDQLEDGIRALCRALGFDEDWGAARLGTKKNASRPTAEPFYTQDLADTVHRINAPDFDRFGYDPGSWRGL